MNPRNEREARATRVEDPCLPTASAFPSSLGAWRRHRNCSPWCPRRDPHCQAGLWTHGLGASPATEVADIPFMREGRGEGTSRPHILVHALGSPPRWLMAVKSVGETARGLRKVI